MLIFDGGSVPYRGSPILDINSFSIVGGALSGLINTNNLIGTGTSSALGNSISNIHKSKKHNPKTTTKKSVEGGGDAI